MNGLETDALRLKHVCARLNEPLRGRSHARRIEQQEENHAPQTISERLLTTSMGQRIRSRDYEGSR